MENRDEFLLEVESLYDEWIYNNEKRNISYGEIAYIESLEQKELNEFYKELLDYFAVIKGDDM